MLNKPQDQNAGEGAVAIQVAGSAEGVTVSQTNNYGLTVEQVRSVAQDSFNANFVQLLGQAGDIAEARAHRVVERFLDRLQVENPAGLNQANTPDFRYALLTAQKAQARSGDENLEELLVELLIERSHEHRRNLQQIVLNEALEVVSRVTDEQIAALSLSFIIRRVSNTGILDLNAFLADMDVLLVPYVAKAKLSNASFSHLAFTGCGVVEMGEIGLSECFRQFYPGLWQAGFTHDDPAYRQLSAQARQFTRPSPHTQGRFEVIGGSADLAERMQEAKIKDQSQRAYLKELINRPPMSPQQIKDRCVAARPYMAELFDLWDNTSMKSFIPSSVGIAIAHANVARVNPRLPPLSVWIN